MKQRQTRYVSLWIVATIVAFIPTIATAQSKTRVIPKKAPKNVQIVKTDDSVLTVYADGFGFCNGSTQGRGTGLDLGNGQSADFDNIKQIDVLGFDDGKAKLRITLINKKSIEFSSRCDETYGPTGRNDMGDVSVPFRQVKQVVFPR